MNIKILMASIAILSLGCSEQENAGEASKASTDEGSKGSIEQGLFEIKLYEHNSSLAYSLQYTLTNGEVTVFQLTGVKGERDVPLYNKKLSDKESNSVRSFIGKFPIDSLQAQYRNQCVLDGDQKTILITIAGKKKQSHVSNFYHEGIAKLIELLNSIIPYQFQINYDKEKLERAMQDCNE